MIDFANNHEENEVPDPYYGGSDGFEKIYQILDKACDVFIEKERNE